MYNNIEIEAKVLLSHEEYKKVYKSLKMNDTMAFTQTNYYIDSPERCLKENDIALRIREINKKYVLTLKTPMSEGLLEKNQDLKEKEALEMIQGNLFPSGEVKDFLEILDINPQTLVILAKMETLRTEINDEANEEVVSLDQNTYGDKIDYELEVDKSAMALAEKRVDEILSPLSIKFEFNKLSKQSRAIAACLKK